ncbi:MAG: excinuclease ABC subunit UvrA, partial [Burkholderiales bacterium]
DMTVSEAAALFSERPDVLRGLEPLQAVGLGYLKLGQPVPTLSGGEAQRLKLAGHLAQAGVNEGGGMLLLFDEPTTGLHFDDIAKLLAAFRRLIDNGHSLVVIEHNLDVIAAADWIIDLGPEGGDAGGEIVCAGTPADVARDRHSHTGAALREYRTGFEAISRGSGGKSPHPPFFKGGPSEAAESSKRRGAIPPFEKGGQGGISGGPMAGDIAKPMLSPRAANHAISIHHAREHNLKNIDVTIPRDSFTVITGVSGSGKSTVAFDILFAEGQRRYLESLNAYARQFVEPVSRPDADAILGVPPTVAIEQRVSRGGRKSTVATQTEIYHFLRLLFVKLGTQYCPDCDIAIEPQTRDAILAQLMRGYRRRAVDFFAPLVVARKGYYTDLAKWARNKGFTHLRVDGTLMPTDAWPRLERFREHDIDLPLGTLTITPQAERE